MIRRIKGAVQEKDRTSDGLLGRRRWKRRFLDV